MIKAVYVEQYGAYWRLSLTEWRAMLESIKAGGGYILGGESGSYGKRLQSRPAHIRSGIERGSRNTWSTRSDMPLYHPLDWDAAEAKFRELDLPPLSLHSRCRQPEIDY